MLAKETKEVFDDDDWLFEIKWDGYRAIAEIENAISGCTPETELLLKIRILLWQGN